MIMENPERSSAKRLPPEKELRHFKTVARSLMIDAHINDGQFAQAVVDEFLQLVVKSQ